jgi:hypothetical protein
MIKKCNFRTVGISGLKQSDIEMYCGLCTFDTALSKDGKTIDTFTKINPLCKGEEDCILFQIYNWLWLQQPIIERRIPIDFPKVKCVCTQCGKKGHFSFSSGYCDECYEKEFHKSGD